MSVVPTHPQRTALYEALQAAAIEAYGALLAAPLADQAAKTFADEASAMLDAMLTEHTIALKERIETQLSGLSLAKGAKRKPAKAPPPANGAEASAVPLAPPLKAETDAAAKVSAPEDAPAKATKTSGDGRGARAIESKSTRPRKRAGGRSSSRG